MQFDNLKTYTKYAAIIAIGLILQFSANELSESFAGLADAMGALYHWSTAKSVEFYDVDTGAGRVLYAAVTMPFMLVVLYVMWLRGVLVHADAVRRAEIEKRFIDYRFLYLLALLRQNTPSTPHPEQRTIPPNSCENR